ncbi:TPA: oligosaccharide flippase family protein [Klebsiella pneumoniae]|uniref:oligosaccharide flippase family protein n=1 Tax=Klebsiella pneumoniae TaxID=573 RepID=UPI0005826202|nr:oligosaccharide flippase family protein [Klebsiella pneumoniae]KGT61983.1 polysaccharide biosynthesis protein [Klebsiella pneumoniae MRSN 1319]MCA5435251.1 oligosaccharide flippase family protein [Klebsiella pneumoniae]MCA6675927.1 oligosaccharide flippase family protein [Klebsiella pneumoniae]MCQ0505427.1 oligosaccharide flippase family protein [Klebsiella pneumoniae]MDD1394420.1 oligosaccharide flippase family protein [Klebsiella pneumoniae]
MSGIKKQAIWLLGSNTISAILQILQISLLAHHLKLSELGVLAIVNMVLMVAMILQDMGMSSYIVHMQEMTRRDQSTIYWINLLLSFLTGCLVFVASWPIASFYNMPDLTFLVMLASFNFLFLGSLSQYQSHYIKAKKVILLAKIEIISKIISFLFVLFSILKMELRTEAVIYGLIINSFARLFLMSLLGDKSWRPTFEFNSAICKPVFKYGIFQLGSQILNQFRTQLDVIVIGKMLGADSLGLYSLAKDLIMQPLKLISPVINRLALPRFAEVQNQSDKLGGAYLRGTSVILLFSMIIFFSIYLLGPVIIKILYGSSRMGVFNILPYMLLFGVLRPMGGLTGAVAQANGKTNIEFRWNVIATSIVLGVTTTVFFIPQLWYVSLSLSLSQLLISFFVFPCFIKPIVDVSFKSYLYKWFPQALCFICLIYIVKFFDLVLYPFW